MMRTQQINAMVEKGTIESEALQSSSSDRPVDESHILDLLKSEDAEGGAGRKQKPRRKTADGRK